MKLIRKGKITHTVTLSGADILDLLPHLGTNYSPPATATSVEVEFLVPGGGDYSNEAVDFMKEEWVRVTWTVEE